MIDLEYPKLLHCFGKPIPERIETSAKYHVLGYSARNSVGKCIFREPLPGDTYGPHPGNLFAQDSRPN